MTFSGCARSPMGQERPTGTAASSYGSEGWGFESLRARKSAGHRPADPRLIFGPAKFGTQVGTDLVDSYPTGSPISAGPFRCTVRAPKELNVEYVPGAPTSHTSGPAREWPTRLLESLRPERTLRTRGCRHVDGILGDRADPPCDRERNSWCSPLRRKRTRHWRGLSDSLGVRKTERSAHGVSGRVHQQFWKRAAACNVSFVMRPQRVWPAVMCAAVLSLGSACASSSRSVSGTLKPIPSSPGSAYGTLTGVLQAVGGPAPGAPRPLPGEVAITNSAGKVVTARASTDGTFSAELPAGAYKVTGRSPLYESGAKNCRPTPPTTVVVASGEPARVTLYCEER
jgi:hypothetical protein